MEEGFGPGQSWGDLLRYTAHMIGGASIRPPPNDNMGKYSLFEIPEEELDIIENRVASGSYGEGMYITFFPSVASDRGI